MCFPLILNFLSSLHAHAWHSHIDTQEHVPYWGLLRAPIAAVCCNKSAVMETVSPGVAFLPGDPSLSASAWPPGLLRPHGRLS